jgi:hypothetical protein
MDLLNLLNLNKLTLVNKMSKSERNSLKTKPSLDLKRHSYRKLRNISLTPKIDYMIKWKTYKKIVKLLFKETKRSKNKEGSELNLLPLKLDLYHQTLKGI